MTEKKFGSFDLNRQLTDYEMEHFDEFMKPIDNSKSAKDVSLTEAVDNTIANLKLLN